MLLLGLLSCELDVSDLLESDTDVDTDADADTDVDTDTDSDADTDTRPIVSGRITFEAPPPTCSPFQCWLDYDSPLVLPVRHHRVVLLDVNGGVMSESWTDADGVYVLHYDDGLAAADLFVFAELALPGGEASVVVVDNTDDGAQWGASGGTLDLTGPTEGVDRLIEDGWNGAAYDHRASAPFGITDAVLDASESFLASRPGSTLPPLTVNWSPDNRPESGEDSLGLIGTSFWSDSEGAIYLLGAADIDTDEFDRLVVQHEWGHYFQDRISRSDSQGGSHPYGAILDPRVAWGEGSATVIASLINPGVAYIDTRGDRQVGGFDNNVEDDDGNVPGWWSERAVQRLMNDVYDDASEPGDSLALGIDAMWAHLVAARTEPAFVTIFSFTEGVRLADPSAATGLDALVSGFGLDPIQDAWGTGETEDGGWAANLPVYAAPGATPVTLHFDGTLANNRLGRHRFVRFQGTGGSVDVVAVSDEDVDVQVFQGADLLDSSALYCNNPPCTETVTVSTTTGTEYRVLIKGYGDPADYTAAVRVDP